MNDLSREACELVYAGREAFRPTEADRARILAAVTGAATLTVTGVAAASTTKLSFAALPGIFRAVHLARLLAITVPVAVGGGYFWHSKTQSSAPVANAVVAPQPQRQPARLVAPPSQAPANVENAGAVEEVASVPATGASPERSVSPAVEPAKPGNQMRQEVALLSKAQRELSSGHAQEALEALGEHAVRFPRGALAEERVATRARALCALNRRREAEAELKRMERLNPDSAYLARAREACGTP